MYCTSVISSFHCAESSPFCNSYYLFTLLFQSKQNRRGNKIVFFYLFFLYVVALNIAQEMCGVISARTAAMCSSCSLQLISNGDG
jgi:hypothetical protein